MFALGFDSRHVETKCKSPLRLVMFAVLVFTGYLDAGVDNGSGVFFIH